MAGLRVQHPEWAGLAVRIGDVLYALEARAGQIITAEFTMTADDEHDYLRFLHSDRERFNPTYRFEARIEAVNARFWRQSIDQAAAVSDRGTAT